MQLYRAGLLCAVYVGVDRAQVRRAGVVVQCQMVLHVYWTQVRLFGVAVRLQRRLLLLAGGIRDVVHFGRQLQVDFGLRAGHVVVVRH